VSERPTAEEPQPQRGSYLSIMLAGLLAAAVFLALFFLTLGAVGPLVVIGAGVFALAAFHYVVWGWWLSRLIQRDVEEEEQ
jgi:hypothetical protein